MHSVNTLRNAAKSTSRFWANQALVSSKAISLSVIPAASVEVFL